MIYALLDKERLLKAGRSLTAMSQKLQQQGISIAQYRNKSQPLAIQRADLAIIRQHYHGKLIINDRIELIQEVDGLHLGQEDIRRFHKSLPLAIKRIRAIIGNKILGLSTHNQAEIEEANQLDLDYIGLGAYRGTTTKVDAKVLGEDALKLAKLSHHPVALIGGVKRTDHFGPQITYRVIGSDLYEN